MRYGCTECGYRYSDVKEHTPIVDPQYCTHTGIIDNRGSTKTVVKYWCDDCCRFIKEVPREEHVANKQLAQQALLAPEAVQATASRLYYNSMVPIPRDIALQAIEQFTTEANRLVKMSSETSTLELVTLRSRVRCTYQTHEQL